MASSIQIHSYELKKKQIFNYEFVNMGSLSAALHRDQCRNKSLWFYDRLVFEE